LIDPGFLSAFNLDNLAIMDRDHHDTERREATCFWTMDNQAAGCELGSVAVLIN